MFPISNWTELDVWRYIGAEELELPPIYYAHEREVFERDGMLYAVSDYVERTPDEPAFTERVRYRTVGDMTITGAVRSDATTTEQVIEETLATRVSERGATRADDRTSARPPWRTASARATSDARPRPPRHRRARSTTASRRSSAACSTTPRR